MTYYAYLAACSDGTIYAGYTANIAVREKEHNEGDGAKYTRGRRPVKIMYFERCETRSDAMKREWALKKLTKAQKEGLIANGLCTRH